MGKTFTTSEVASHNKPDNLYIIVDEDVYDLTKFQDEHPGKLLRLPAFLLPAQPPTSQRLNKAKHSSQAEKKSSLESLAKTPRSNSGNTTMKASSRNTRVSYRSDR